MCSLSILILFAVLASASFSASPANACQADRDGAIWGSRTAHAF